MAVQALNGPFDRIRSYPVILSKELVGDASKQPYGETTDKR
jgi:hypothetical protein